MESTAPHHGSLVTVTETQRAQALAHFHLIRPFLDDGVPLTHLAALHRLSVRTLRRWVQQYRAHGLVGLSKAIRKDQGQRRSLTPQLRHIIEALALQKPRSTVAHIHRETVRLSREHHWTPPSYSTVQRIIHQMDPQLTTLAHEGAKAYAEAFDLIYRHQASAPNAVWQADHSLLPLVVRNDHGKPGKPWLTIILDDYSRAVAGYSLGFASPTAQQTALTLHQAIWRKADPRWHLCGIPSTFYMEYVPRNIFHIMCPFVLCGLTTRRSVISRWRSSVWPHNAYRDWSHWRSDGSSRQMGFPGHAAAVSVNTAHAWSASAFIRSVISA
jgi:putative transposase